MAGQVKLCIAFLLASHFGLVKGNDVELFSVIILSTWGLRVISIIIVGLIICCKSNFRPSCCRGKQRRGFVIGTNVPVQPTTHLIPPQIPQAVVVQHSPPETMTSQHAPPYTIQIQQQFQHPSTEHLLQQDPKQPVGFQ